MEFFKFIFSSFWTFAGFFLLSLVVVAIIKSAFDFVVELIHGKPMVNNYYLDKDVKIEKKEKTDNKPKIDGKMKFEPPKVNVRNNE